MNDPNPNPRNTGQGSSNMVWIIAAVLVVVAAVWYVMRDKEEAVVVTDPAPAESVVVEPTPDVIIEEPVDGISVETTPEAPVSN